MEVIQRGTNLFTDKIIGKETNSHLKCVHNIRVKSFINGFALLLLYHIYKYIYIYICNIYINTYIYNMYIYKYI